MQCLQQLDRLCCFVSENQPGETVLPECEFDALRVDAVERDVARRGEMGEEDAECVRLAGPGYAADEDVVAVERTEHDSTVVVDTERELAHRVKRYANRVVEVGERHVADVAREVDEHTHTICPRY